MVEHSGETASPAHHRPNYFLVFLGLLALTVIEVGITYLSLPRGLVTVALLAFMTFKVLLVVMFYMHLRFDSKWFAYLFLIPAPFVLLILGMLLLSLRR